MLTVIFLCAQNSARSQMAEGLARAAAPKGWRFYSAGSRPGLVNPLAERVMRDIGIDISFHRSKGVDSVPIEEADLIVTLCAEEECPVVSSHARRLTWNLPDPAAVTGPTAERLATFRRVRDEIGKRLEQVWSEAAKSEVRN